MKIRFDQSFNVKYSANNNNNEPESERDRADKEGVGAAKYKYKYKYRKKKYIKINRKPVANIVCCCGVSVLWSGISTWLCLRSASESASSGSGPSSRYGMWMCFPSGDRLGSHLGRGSGRGHGIPGARAGIGLGNPKSKSLRSRSRRNNKTNGLRHIFCCAKKKKRRKQEGD